MLRQSLIALWAIVVLTMITVTVCGAGPATSHVRNQGAQHQVGKPKFEDIKLQTGIGASGPSTGTLRGPFRPAGASKDPRATGRISVS